MTLYGLSAIYSIFLFRRGFRRDDRVNYCILLVAFCFHLAAMMQRGFSLDRCPIRNLFEATMFIAFTMVATYLVIGVWHRLRFLGAFASPVLLAIGVFALMPGLDKPGANLEMTNDAWLSLHVSLFALSYGAMGLSAVAALMFLTQERNLKVHKIRAVLSLMPPIQRLEVTTSRLMVAGLALLTVALAVSVAGYKHFKGIYFTGDPKVIWSFCVWVLYLTMVVMRWKFAHGGRRFAWGAVGGFRVHLADILGRQLLVATPSPGTMNFSLESSMTEQFIVNRPIQRATEQH